jgi:hypothetical protein
MSENSLFFAENKDGKLQFDARFSIERGKLSIETKPIYKLI